MLTEYASAGATVRTDLKMKSCFIFSISLRGFISYLEGWLKLTLKESDCCEEWRNNLKGHSNNFYFLVFVSLDSLWVSGFIHLLSKRIDGVLPSSGLPLIGFLFHQWFIILFLFLQLSIVSSALILKKRGSDFQQNCSVGFGATASSGRNRLLIWRGLFPPRGVFHIWFTRRRF